MYFNQVWLVDLQSLFCSLHLFATCTFSPFSHIFGPRGIGKTLDNDLNKVVASSGFSENKGLGGVLSLTGS